MAAPNQAAQGIVARLLSAISRGTDGQPSNVQGPRMMAYNEQGVIGLMGFSSHPLADEGSYFKIANATPGTGLATIATPTAFSDTSPFFIVQNNEPVGGRSVYMDFVRLSLTVPGTLSTSLRLTTKLDPVSTRYSSGATMIVNATGATGGQIVNPRSSLASFTSIAAWVGPLVATAASQNARLLCPDLVLRAAIAVALDSYLIKFGGGDMPVTGAVLNGAAPSDIVKPHEPVIIEPGHAFLGHIWAPAQTVAASMQFEAAGWLR